MSCSSARYQDYEDDWVDFTSVEFTVLQKRCQGSQPSQNQSESQLKKRSGKLPSLNSSQRFSPLKGPKVENGETKVKRKVLKKVTRAARRDFFVSNLPWDFGVPHHGVVDLRCVFMRIFTSLMYPGRERWEGRQRKAWSSPMEFCPTLCSIYLSLVQIQLFKIHHVTMGKPRWYPESWLSKLQLLSLRVVIAIADIAMKAEMVQFLRI